MFFVGMHELVIDSKNRLSIPHAHRSKMNCDTDGRSFYVIPGDQPGTLAFVPERYFESTRSHTPAPEQLSDRAQKWRRFEYSQSALLDPDSQGRVVIPERLLKRAGIGKEVTLIGVQDRLELWSREAYDAFQDGSWQDYPEQRAAAMEEMRQWQETQRASSTAGD